MSTRVPLPHRDGRPPRPQRPRPVKPRKLPPLGKGLLGTWKKPPKLDKTKFKVGKVGGGPRKGMYVARRLPPAAVPPAAADPYAGHPDAHLLRAYEGQPWAQNAIRTARSDQQHHEGYVSDKVMPWLSAAMTGLAGINSAAQNQFTGMAQAAGQGMAQAGGAQPGVVAGVSGGAVADPNAYRSAASAQAMSQSAATMGQVAQWQGLMGTLQQTTFSQGQVAALSDYAKGLPALYARKRQELIDGIDKYIAEQQAEEAKLALAQAEFEEKKRSNRVNEAIRATNAETNAAIQFGRLGIDAAGEVRRGQPDPPPPVYDNVPEGYVQTPDGQIRPDRSGTGGGGGGNAKPGRGEYPPNQLRKEGYRPLPKGAGPKYRRNATVATDGSLWYKPAGGKKGSGGSTTGGREARDAGTLADELVKKYRGSQDPFSPTPGWVDTFRGDTGKVTSAVTSWVLNNRKSFTLPNGKFDVKTFRMVLDAIGGPAGNNTTSRVWAQLRKRIDAQGRLR